MQNSLFTRHVCIHLWLSWLRPAHSNFLVFGKRVIYLKNTYNFFSYYLQKNENGYKIWKAYLRRKHFGKFILYKAKLLINCFQMRPVGSYLERYNLAKACWVALLELHRYTNTAHTLEKRDLILRASCSKKSPRELKC